MFANGNIAQLLQRYGKNANSDSLATRRRSRVRKHPRLEGLEMRCLLSGNPAISEFPIPTPSSLPVGGMTAGPDGNLWFTEEERNQIGRITPSGTITEFAIPTPNSDPQGIAAARDGNLWFTESGASQIGRITPSGTITEFTIPAFTSEPLEITAGPDGNLWFTESSANEIGQLTPVNTGVLNSITVPANATVTTPAPNSITFPAGSTIPSGFVLPAGTITEFAIGTADSGASGITAGPDGNLWFTEDFANQIGRITPSGTITEFAIPTYSSFPTEITAGSDGSLWFTEFFGNQIGRITPTATTLSNPTTVPADATITTPVGTIFPSGSTIPAGTVLPPGTITEFAIPSSDSRPRGITAGSDGNLWFTEDLADQIGRLTPSGIFTEFPISTVSSIPAAITAGPDGNLWFTEAIGNKIGRLDPPLTAAGTSVSASEGVPFTGVVATFTDPDPLAKPGDYTTTITWDDGTTTAGQVTEDTSGTFYVSGSHTYADPGYGLVMNVTIADQDGNTTTVTSFANVSQAPLLGVGLPVVVTEGVPVPAGSPVASFTDSGGRDPLGDYSASITWGDGMNGPATVLYSDGAFLVLSAADHTYTKAGTYQVTVAIDDSAPASPGDPQQLNFATTSANVGAAALTPVAVSPLPTEPKGTPLSGVVSAFTSADPIATVSDFTATIDWGDGSPQSVGVLGTSAGNTFTVTGDHTYVRDETTPYHITVTVNEQGGAALVTTTAATVTNRPPLVTGIPVKMTKGLPFAAPVAYIVEDLGLPAEPPGNFAATINWGDGTKPTTGTVAAIPGGDWVVGNHTYANSGPYTITITVNEGAFTVVATALAFDPPAVPGGPSRHFHRGTARSRHRAHASPTEGTAKPHRVGEPLENPHIQAAHLRKLVP
jgi:streptogramin lyase